MNTDSVKMADKLKLVNESYNKIIKLAICLSSSGNKTQNSLKLFICVASRQPKYKNKIKIEVSGKIKLKKNRRVKTMDNRPRELSPSVNWWPLSMSSRIEWTWTLTGVNRWCNLPIVVFVCSVIKYKFCCTTWPSYVCNVKYNWVVYPLEQINLYIMINPNLV